MLYVDDIILVNESLNGVHSIHEVCRQFLETKGLSKIKTKYMIIQF